MIRGKLVTLRAPELADVPLLNRWANDESVWRNLGGWHFPYSSRSTEAWVRSRSDADPVQQAWCVGVEGGRLIGTANLTHIDLHNGSAEHGLMFPAEADRGKGYAIDTTLTILRYAFDELGLRRVDGEVLGDNQRSLAFADKLGWRVEGLRRGWYYRGGRFQDKILIGITRDEYHARVEQMHYWDA